MEYPHVAHLKKAHPIDYSKSMVQISLSCFLNFLFSNFISRGQNAHVHFNILITSYLLNLIFFEVQ
jgi:hypothetical protein